MKKIICIVGPTASGKSSLGIELAKVYNAEIISADSMQIYKELNIGTAKVSKEEQEQVKHHLIDFCDLNKQFSVADYKKMCYETIEKIHKCGKNVILVGGTGLYISAVVNDMNFENQTIDVKYRNNLYNIASQEGNQYIWNILNKIDPKSAQLIHKNNLKRVIRAIEIATYSEEKKSEHMSKETDRIKNSKQLYDFCIYYIDFEREKIYNRINQRVDNMVSNGLIEEAKMVYDKHLDNSATCMQAIGYKEFFSYFQGLQSLDESILKLKQETRNYAKRQMTWFKNKLNIHILNGEKDISQLVSEIINSLSD
ncbi:MAG: tRNA (adenosine(37)-N6)-dimethylallyltransferase MiaA [Clostridia bacterium]